MLAAEMFVDFLGIYTLAGAIFAALFVSFGIHRIDPVAARSPLSFRLVVMPGVAALWPVLLLRWVRSTKL